MATKGLAIIYIVAMVLVMVYVPSTHGDFYGGLCFTPVWNLPDRHAVHTTYLILECIILTAIFAIIYFFFIKQKKTEGEGVREKLI